MRLCKPPDHVTNDDMRLLGDVLGTLVHLGEYEKEAFLTHTQRNANNEFRQHLLLTLATRFQAETGDQIPF